MKGNVNESRIEFPCRLSNIIKKSSAEISDDSANKGEHLFLSEILFFLSLLLHHRMIVVPFLAQTKRLRHDDVYGGEGFMTLPFSLA